MFSGLFTVFLTGFTTTLMLIMAIGAQNAFILRQGLQRQHVFASCSFCILSDIFLIILGVLGFAAAVELYPSLPRIMAIGGAVFLVFYGGHRLYAAWRADYQLDTDGKPAVSLKRTLLILAAMTWLNPHVYLDTMGLIGAVSTKFTTPQDKTIFTLGACFASATFFYSLGYGARYLAPIMQSQRAWQILDIFIALLMFFLAISLLF